MVKTHNGTAPQLLETEQIINLTDLGNSRRLIKTFGDRIRYVPAAGKWLMWDGTRWAYDDTGAIERCAKEVIMRMYREASEITGDGERKRLIDWARSSESRAKIVNMIHHAKSERGATIKPEELDADQWLLNTINGTINLRTGVLQEHNPDDLITRRVNVEYNPRAKCPTWEKFINRVMAGDQDVIAYLQRGVGYTLTGDTSEQCLFFMVGTGKNGKSTFTETLIVLLQEFTVKTPTETLMKRDGAPGASNDLARLAGKRLAVARETDEGQRLDEAKVKDMTGGDTITARYLFREYFDFKPTNKIWMYGNHMPLVRGVDDGFWRRMRIIPFSVTIPETERDPHLQERLQDELPGILNWAIAGCLAWQDQGMGMPLAVKTATEQYRSDMDVMQTFIEDCCTVWSGGMVTAKLMYIAYSGWCIEMGERPASQRGLGLRLKERGFTQHKGTAGSRFWAGIELRAKE